MRNKVFIVLFALLFTFGIAFADNDLISAKSSKKILVAYYSWGGNTKSIAEKIHKKVGGDIFEINYILWNISLFTAIDTFL